MSDPYEGADGPAAPAAGGLTVAGLISLRETMRQPKLGSSSLMVKDSKKYAATGGWGYAQFDKDGKPADATKHGTCYPCHVPAKDRDYLFTRYAP